MVVKFCCCWISAESMDDHVKTCEELFSAARSEFKHLEHYFSTISRN